MEQTKKTRQEIEELFKSAVISKEEHDNLLEETRDHEQSHDKGITQYIIPVIATLAILGIPFAFIFCNTKSHYQQEEPLEVYSDSCCISSATSKDVYQTNDYFADEKGEPLLIDLGTFKEFNGFSQDAQRTFKEGIPIRVAITKDLKRISKVDIKTRWAAKNGGYQLNMDSRKTLEIDSKHIGATHYGPVIYDISKPWLDIKVLILDRNKKVPSPYQPICLLNGVMLENIPSAEKASEQLLRFLRYTGKLTWNEGTKQATKANGQPLTEHEYETAKRFKLITTKKVLFFFEQDNGVHPIYKNM